MKQAPKVYEAVVKLMYQKAARFDKKHGNWLVRYAPRKQVILMDTWNGQVFQAHVGSTLIVNNGYPDSQLHGRIHTIISKNSCELHDTVMIYKALLHD